MWQAGTNVCSERAVEGDGSSPQLAHEPLSRCGMRGDSNTLI